MKAIDRQRRGMQSSMWYFCVWWVCVQLEMFHLCQTLVSITSGNFILNPCQTGFLRNRRDPVCVCLFVCVCLSGGRVHTFCLHTCIKWCATSAVINLFCLLPALHWKRQIALAEQKQWKRRTSFLVVKNIFQAIRFRPAFYYENICILLNWMWHNYIR